MHKSPISTAQYTRQGTSSVQRRLALLGVATVVTGSLFINACGLDIGLDRFGNLTIRPESNERDFFDAIGDGISSLFDDDDGGDFFDDLF